MNLHTKKKKKPLVLFGISFLSFIVIFSIISMIVTIFMYNRQFPRVNPPDDTITTQLIYEDFEEIYPRSLFSFDSSNHKLQGYLYGEQNDQGLIVMAHGLGGGADSFLPQIIYFVNQGWQVLAYDATGSYRSEGKTTKGFPQSILDLKAALDYIDLQEQFDDLQIVLYGHSWGGYAVANVLHYDVEVAGIVSVSAANSSMEMMMEFGESMMGKLIISQYPYLWFYQQVLFGNTVSFSAVDAINHSNIPALIIHGTEDELFRYNGSSIISKKDKITNQKARFITISESYRNGHNNVFRSLASFDYLEQVNKEYRVLYDQYDQEIPYSINQDFYKTLDRSLIQELDTDLMDQINEFFKECLNR